MTTTSAVSAMASSTRELIALPVAVGAAAALCAAMPQALVWLGCLELGLLNGCVAVPGGVAALEPLTLGGMLAAVVVFLAALAIELARHARLAAALRRLAHPATLAGERVRLVPGMRGAMVAGLGRPEIYCSSDLVARLDADELEAVMLHERHHRRTLAPLRLVMLAAIGRFISWSAPGRRWLARRQAAIEIAADAHVLAAGLPKPVLARAIVRLFDADSVSPAPMFSTAADLRLAALLDDWPPPAAPPYRLLAAGAGALLLACALIG